MSSKTDNENFATIIIVVSAVVSVLIGFASGSIAKAFGSFLGILFLSGIIGSLVKK